jgi:hypothetical protein
VTTARSFDGQASFDADDRSDASYVWRAGGAVQPDVIATPTQPPRRSSNQEGADAKEAGQ